MEAIFKDGEHTLNGYKPSKKCYLVSTIHTQSNSKCCPKIYKITKGNCLKYIYRQLVLHQLCSKNAPPPRSVLYAIHIMWCTDVYCVPHGLTLRAQMPSYYVLNVTVSKSPPQKSAVWESRLSLQWPTVLTSSY